MQRTLLFILVSGILAGAPFAHAQPGPGMGPMMHGHHGMMAEGPKMGPMMHNLGMEPGGHLLMLLKRARRIAPQELRRQILDLEDRYFGKVLRHRAEIQAAQHHLFRLLQDPEASDQEIQKAHRAVMEKKKALGQLCLQGLLDLRNTLGPDVFAQLFEMAGPPQR